MDPFSISAGIAGLLSLSLQVRQIVTEHFESAKNAPKEARSLAEKLTAIIGVLEQLERFIEKHARNGQFNESSILYGTIKRYDEHLSQLDESLSTFVDATKRDQKNIRRYISKQYQDYTISSQRLISH